MTTDAVANLFSGHVIVTPAGEILGADSVESRELARRVKACINACEGISTEELEQGIVHDMCRVLGQVAPLLQAQSKNRSTAEKAA